MKNYIATRRNRYHQPDTHRAEEALVPATPSRSPSRRRRAPRIPYECAVPLPAAAFAGQNGATFSAMKWRLAEATEPARPAYLPFSHVSRRAL